MYFKYISIYGHIEGHSSLPYSYPTSLQYKEMDRRDLSHQRGGQTKPVNRWIIIGIDKGCWCNLLMTCRAWQA